VVVKRRSPPRSWRDPTKYKPYLRRNFSYTCSYAWVHESWLGGELTFEVEHHKPEGRPEFEFLRCYYNNLYYVWGPCNRAKGNSWPSLAEEGLGFRFIDPCHDCVWEHLGYELIRGRFTGCLVALTPAAEYTLEKCDLNNSVLRHQRRKKAREFIKERTHLRRLEVMLGDPTLSAAALTEFEDALKATHERILEILVPRPLPPDPLGDDVASDDEDE
jgi:hypothetical protein